MFKKLLGLIIVIGTTLVLNSACSLNREQNTEIPVDVEATANAMVEAMLAAEAEKQDEIETAVQATVTTVEAQATPVMVDEDLVQLSEEEIAEMIDQAVAAAQTTPSNLSQPSSYPQIISLKKEDYSTDFYSIIFPQP